MFLYRKVYLFIAQRMDQRSPTRSPKLWNVFMIRLLSFLFFIYLCTWNNLIWREIVNWQFSEKCNFLVVKFTVAIINRKIHALNPFFQKEGECRTVNQMTTEQSQWGYSPNNYLPKIVKNSPKKKITISPLAVFKFFIVCLYIIMAYMWVCSHCMYVCACRQLYVRICM